MEIIVSGTDKSYTLDTNGTVSIHCTGALNNFISVEMDGNQVDESNYSVADGSTLLTFKTEYLESLSVGEHTVTLNYKVDRSVDTTLTILAKAGGETGGETGEGGETGDSGEAEDSGEDMPNNGQDESLDSQNQAAPKNNPATGDSNISIGWWILAIVTTGLIACIYLKRWYNIDSKRINE